MARLERLYAPGIPQLVHIQLAFSLRQEDTFYKSLFSSLGAASLYEVKVHAWSFLDRDLYLLLTPSNEKAIPKLMQQLGRQLATLRKQGAVFQGRYKSTLVEEKFWVLPVMIWLESERVQQEGLGPSEYWPWSSCQQHIGIASCPIWMVDHVDYWAIGNTPFERQSRYKKRLQDGLGVKQSQQIAEALFGQWALVREENLSQYEMIANRRLMPAQRGRPKKHRNRVEENS